MEEIFTPFLFLLKTRRRAVGVVRSVNTSPKETVSVEKVSTASGDCVKSSLMHEEAESPKIMTTINNIRFRTFIYKKTLLKILYCTMKYMLVAGEASGDLHASNLIDSIKNYDPEATFRFIGGDLMAKSTRKSPEIHYEQLNVMGFADVIKSLPSLLKNLKKAKQIVR